MSEWADEFTKNYDSYDVISTVGKDTLQIRLTNYNKIAILKKVDNADIYKKLKALNIKGIPAIYSIFSKDDGDYVIEEYINGTNLGDLLASKGAFNRDEVKSIIIRLCDILSQIHREDIIHRDIKPSNIILTSTNEVYLIDFGISRYKNDIKSKDTRLLGTEFYASPEQYGFAQTDCKSDIYSVGKLMMVLLAGREDVEINKKLPFYGIIKKCVSVDASKRFKSAEELKKALCINKVFFAVLAVLLVAVVIAVIRFSAAKNTITENGMGDKITKSELDSEKDSEENSKENSKDKSEKNSKDDNPEKGEHVSEKSNEESTESENKEETTGDTTEEAESSMTLPRSSTSKKENSNSEGGEKSQVTSEKDKSENTTSKSENASEKSTSANNVSNASGGNNEKNLSSDVKKNTIKNNIAYSSHNQINMIYVQDESIEINSKSPKQYNQVKLSNSLSPYVYTEYDSNGLYITLNDDKRLTIPCTSAAQVGADTSGLSNIDRCFTVVFYDFDDDGISDMFVNEYVYGLDSEGYETVAYNYNTFVDVNADLTMTSLPCNMPAVVGDFVTFTLYRTRIDVYNPWTKSSVGEYRMSNNEMVYTN